MSGMSLILGVMKEQIRANGMIWGGCAIGGLVFKKVKSKVLGLLLGARGINLGAGCHFNGIRCMRFGRDLSVRSNLWLEAVTRYEGEVFTPQIVIGDRVSMSDGVHITAILRVEIGNDVLFGSRVFVSDHNHGAYAGEDQCAPDQPPVKRALHSRGPVIIEDNVWLGDNVNIVGPVRIGFGAVIGANSVVRSDVPALAIAAGSPARVLKTYDEAAAEWVAADQRRSR